MTLMVMIHYVHYNVMVHHFFHFFYVYDDAKMVIAHMIMTMMHVIMVMMGNCRVQVLLHQPGSL